MCAWRGAEEHCAAYDDLLHVVGIYHYTNVGKHHFATLYKEAETEILQRVYARKSGERQTTVVLLALLE